MFVVVCNDLYYHCCYYMITSGSIGSTYGLDATKLWLSAPNLSNAEKLLCAGKIIVNLNRLHNDYRPNNNKGVQLCLFRVREFV